MLVSLFYLENGEGLCYISSLEDGAYKVYTMLIFLWILLGQLNLFFKGATRLHINK
jgi:hypothetical protein